MAPLAPVKLSDSLILLEGPTKQCDPLPKATSIDSSGGHPRVDKPTPAEIILSLLRKDSNGKYCNVFETLTSVEVLKLAYETIKSKPGNMVRGSTKETLDGITLK
jgi:hypothetical protein